jgi:mono/diheme cytochrome c family protein
MIKLLKKSLFPILLISGFYWSSCDDNPYKQGKIYYSMYCANCHMDSGEGLKGIIPPLGKIDYLLKNRQNLPCVIRKGLKGNVTVNGINYNQQEMLPIAKLTDFEITNILNYIGTAWGNNEKLFTVEEVRDGLNKCL